MLKLEDLFIVHRAQSGILSKYSPGEIPYLANGFKENAVAAYVTPLLGDKVFQFRAIVVSAFGEVTVQMPPFIAYGAAGTSLTVLEPRTPKTDAELAYLAAWLGAMMRGRFTWYYRSIPSRIKRMPVPDAIPTDIDFDVKTFLPSIGQQKINNVNPKFKLFSIQKLFYVHRARSFGFDKHERGEVTFVSNGTGTGIVGYVKPLPEEKVFNSCAIVISALSGATIQAPPFIARGSAGSGLVVLEPKRSMGSEMLLCAAAYFNRAISWRFNWSRQLTADKIRRLFLLLPSRDGNPNEDDAKFMVASIPYWQFLKERLTI